MPEPKLRIALIGGGMIANAGHIPAWKSVEGAEVVAVADAIEENAFGTAGRHGIAHAYTDPEAMIAAQRPDIVVVCTPNCCHRDHALLALHGGAHVICEKPLAASYADAAAVFDAASEAGRIVTAAQTLRFCEAVVAAKEFADRGELGEIYHAEASQYRRRGVPTWGRFHIKSYSGGGPLFDMGAHALDSLLWWLGNPPVTTATGMTYTKLANCDEHLVSSLADRGAPVGVFNARPYDFREFDVEDLAVGFLRLADRATVLLNMAWAANVPENTGGFLVLGTGGGLWLDPALRSLKVTQNMGQYQVDITPKLAVPERPVPFRGHYRLAAHFARVVRGQEELLIKPAETLNLIGALEALYRSAERCREIRLDGSQGVEA